MIMPMATNLAPHEGLAPIKSQPVDSVVLGDHMTKTIISPVPQCLWLPTLTGR